MNNTTPDITEYAMHYHTRGHVDRDQFSQQLADRYEVAATTPDCIRYDYIRELTWGGRRLVEACRPHKTGAIAITMVLKSQTVPAPAQVTS